MKETTRYELSGIIWGFIMGVAFTLALLAGREARAEDICYAPYSTDVTPEYVVTNLLVTTHIFATVEELAADVGEDVASYSICETIVEENIAWCEIWIVQPTKVLGDPYMDGIGHEVAHGIWGDFHPEDNLEE